MNELQIGREASKNGRNTRNWGDNQREVTRSHGSRDHAKDEKSQWRGRMAHATARNGKAQVTRRRGRRERVAGKNANDASAWMTRSRDMRDLHNLQNSLGAILGPVLTQFSAQKSRLEPENMQKPTITFILHNFSFFRSSFTPPLGFLSTHS